MGLDKFHQISYFWFWAVITNKMVVPVDGPMCWRLVQRDSLLQLKAMRGLLHLEVGIWRGLPGSINSPRSVNQTGWYLVVFLSSEYGSGLMELLLYSWYYVALEVRTRLS